MKKYLFGSVIALSLFAGLGISQSSTLLADGSGTRPSVVQSAPIVADGSGTRPTVVSSTTI